ncbi:MAG: hypothetical protein Q8L26_01620 [Candidatus Omnitrophota bacterium]|nr:hypothetical protein [Candidatus Omnitrophota bacterium]
MQTIKRRLIIPVALTCLFILAWTSGLFAQAGNKGGVVWVVDFKDGTNAEVIKFNADSGIELSRKGGFKQSKDLTRDPRDGSIWVIDTGNNQIVRLSSDGSTELARLSGFAYPHHGSLNIADESFWVADEKHSEVVKLSADGKSELLRISGFNLPHDIEVSSYDGSVWVLDLKSVIKLSPSGEILGRLDGLEQLRHFAISPFDGSCWVLKSSEGMVKISPDGTKMLTDNPDISGLELSVNPIDGSCWVADSKSGILYNIASDGKTRLLKLDSLFKAPIAISAINPLDGSFWVGDSGRGEIIKISGTGKELKKITGLVTPDDIIEAD